MLRCVQLYQMREVDTVLLSAGEAVAPNLPF